MRLSLVMRVINNQALDALKKSITKTIIEASPYINTIKERNKEIMYEKFVNINKWYTRVIGLDEVKLSQEKVTALQDQLLQTQEKRRDIGRQLSEVRQKSLELQDELHKVKRQDDLERFLDLMKKETEILKLEKSITGTFQLYDQTERELFTAFTNAIRDSHEKQRAQLEYTKYFGIVLSILGSFLTFCYSTMRKQDLKRFIEEKMLLVSSSNSQPGLLDNLIESHKNTLEEVRKNRAVLNKVVETISMQSSKQIDLKNLNMLTVEEQQENESRMRIYKVIGGVCFLYILLKAVGN